ncbi:unnamed protein product [Rotaria sp. Silwood1]|nr:unnamed protein product [Rotaria sp. Silwood1]CAF1288269.1 unnamed protein product [Rotaria sp. Silwood1]
MNYLYLNNVTQQPITHSYVFNKRNEKIDWRRIAAVDVERIARELDFQVLQDNIEHIALCNIDMEIDTRAMDPNFVKLYKMAQLIIEYLLLCQDQISSQLVDYEQIKSKTFQDHEESRREMEKLKNDLNTTKKESKKRKKMIETLQKMLTNQQPAHHTCPICAHSFLSVDYLQAHIHRRHPEYGSGGRREHDVDMEKENQRIKDELRTKETELQLIKVQKGLDEDKIRERDGNIRQLKEEMQTFVKKMTELEEKYFTLRSSTQNQPTSPRQRETGVKELLKDNKILRTENEQLKQSSQQAENNLKKQNRRLERDIQKLQKQINDLNENIRILENTSGNTNQLSEQLIQLRNRYNEEKNRRKNLQDELDETNKKLAKFQNQPHSKIDRKSPVPTPRSSVSPPPIRPTIRPGQTIEIFLPQYCPSLVRQINQNPRYLNHFRNETKNQLNDEFQQHEDLNINERDTRLSDKDYPTKMKIIEQTRQNIRMELPNFERIRSELSQTLDKIAMDRIKNQHSSGKPSRSSTGKLVKFDDDSQPYPSTIPTKRPATTTTKTVQPKSKYNQNYTSTKFASDDDDDDDDEKTNTYDSDDYDQQTKSGVTSGIQPSPRKNVPSTAVSTLVSGNMRPITTNNTKTISAIVRPKSTMNENETESSDEESQSRTNVATKTRILDQKLNEISSKGQKPTINALPQGFQPSRTTLSNQNNKNDDDDDDDNDSDSLTSIHDTNVQRKPSVGTVPQNPIRPSITHNQNLSSGDASQYTYDSIWKSPAGKGPDHRRPPTADSAKTSNMDSDDDLDGEDSN